MWSMFEPRPSRNNLVNNIHTSAMESGSSKRTTVYVAGFAPQVNEQQLLDAFVTFGDILEISMPGEEGGGAGESRGWKGESGWVEGVEVGDGSAGVEGYRLSCSIRT